jgi:hypothetical protein
MANEHTPNRKSGSLYQIIWFAIAFVGVVVAIALLFGLPPMWRWAWVAIVMFAVLLIAGRLGTSWGWFGALVDPQRGKYSLGQLQLVGWTILVMSAWLGIVITRIALGVPDKETLTEALTAYSEAVIEENAAEMQATQKQVDTILAADVTYTNALDVEIPAEVLILLGISAGSLVSGVAIKSEKAKPPERGGPNVLDDANAKHPETARPSWIDIFKGDQKGDKDYIDIGKFQMFWFTVAALVAYGMQVYASMDLATSSETLQNLGLSGVELARAGFALVDSLPAVGASLAGVLGISHVAYLANKIPERQVG